MRFVSVIIQIADDFMNYVNATSNHMELDMNATSNDNLIEFNVLRNSIEDFDSDDQTNLRYQYNCFDDQPQEGHNILRRQHHIDDIVPQDFVEVNIDYKQQGVAGFDSWGDRVLPEFTIPSNQNYSYGFSIIPIQKEEDIDTKFN